MKRRRPPRARIAARDLNATFIGATLTVHGWSEKDDEPTSFTGVLSDLEHHKGRVTAYISGRPLDLADDVVIDVKAPE